MLIYQRVYSFVWKYGTSNGTSKFSNRPLAHEFSLYGQEITPGISKWSGRMEGHGSFIPGVHGLEHQATGKDLWETLGKSLENHRDFPLPCPSGCWRTANYSMCERLVTVVTRRFQKMDDALVQMLPQQHIPTCASQAKSPSTFWMPID